MVKVPTHDQASHLATGSHSLPGFAGYLGFSRGLRLRTRPRFLFLVRLRIIATVLKRLKASHYHDGSRTSSGFANASRFS